MPKKNVNIDTLPFDFDEMVTTVARHRENNKYFWWIGVFDPEDKHPPILSSLRGHFDGKIWIPVGDEMADCCKPLMKIAAPSDPLSLFHHCITEEHVREMLLGHTEIELIQLHQDLLTQTMAKLVNLL